MILANFTIHTRSSSISLNETGLFTLHLIRYLHLAPYLGENTDCYISNFRSKYPDLSDIVDAHSLFLSPFLSISILYQLSSLFAIPLFRARFLNFKIPNSLNINH